MDKRGQVTVFVIIGIILLLSTALILYIRSQMVGVPGAEEVVEEVPFELQEFKAFADNCVKKTAEDAATKIGFSGGYIGVGKDSLQYTSKEFKLSKDNPTESDVLAVSEGWNVPYWHYLESANTCSGNCKFDSQRPPLYRNEGEASIERQIDRYVTDQLRSCLGNFENFKAQGYVIEEKGIIEATSIVTNTNIEVFVTFPLEITRDGASTRLSRFKGSVDVNLKRLYDAATEVTNLEGSVKFLEQNIIDLIYAYGAIDEDALPPAVGTGFSTTSLTWDKQKTIEKMQAILSIYTNTLQVANTQNFDVNFYPESPIKTGMYSRMVVPLEGSYFDLIMDFNYLGWPIYFYISDDDPIRSRGGLNVPILSLLVPIQRYDLPYDVSHPVLMEIRDPYALGGRGYSFFFALESNIRNDEPLDENFVALPQADALEGALICDDNQRTSGNVTIRTVSPNGKPLPGVIVVFTLGDRGCIMGETKLTEDGKEAVFNGKFPRGAIGMLTLRYPGFEIERVGVFSAAKDAKDLGVFAMKEYKVKNIKAEVYDINKVTIGEATAWEISSNPRNLKGNEKLFVMLEKKKENEFDSDFVTAAEIKQDAAELYLIPGKYNARIILIQEGVKIRIPPQRRCSGGVAGVGETCVDMPEVILTGTGEIKEGEYGEISKEFAALPESEVKEITGKLKDQFMTMYETELEVDERMYEENTLVVSALNFNIVDVPENFRVVEDMEAWGNVQKYAKAARSKLGIRYTTE